jgi:hypothetical protein
MSEVEALARRVWQARQDGRLTRDDVLLSQQLYVAVACDITTHTTIQYDPEMDRRVEWLRAVIRQTRMRNNGVRMAVEADLEALVDWLLHGEKLSETCGKERAAGAA